MLIALIIVSVLLGIALLLLGCGAWLFWQCLIDFEKAQAETNAEHSRTLEAMSTVNQQRAVIRQLEDRLITAGQLPKRPQQLGPVNLTKSDEIVIWE